MERGNAPPQVSASGPYLDAPLVEEQLIAVMVRVAFTA